MATQAITRIEVVRTMGGDAPVRINFPEASTRTFKKGAVLVFNASGFVDEAPANPGGANSSGIIGIADADAQNTTNNGDVNTPVILSVTENIFRGNAAFVTAGAAVAATSLFGLTSGGASFVGQMFGVTKLSSGAGSGNWVVDLAKQGANRRVIIVNFDPRGTSYPSVSDTFPIVEFIFFQLFSAFGMTS